MTVVQTNLVIMMKSGIYRGPAKLSITPTTPQGAAMPSIQLSVNFEGDNDHGTTIHIPMAFPVQEPGVYWFELSINGQTLSSLSMRILYQQVAAQMTLPMG